MQDISQAQGRTFEVGDISNLCREKRLHRARLSSTSKLERKVCVKYAFSDFQFLSNSNIACMSIPKFACEASDASGFVCLDYRSTREPDLNSSGLPTTQVRSTFKLWFFLNNNAYGQACLHRLRASARRIIE
jgi:hypothetical protein